MPRKPSVLLDYRRGPLHVALEDVDGTVRIKRSIHGVLPGDPALATTEIELPALPGLLREIAEALQQKVRSLKGDLA